MARASLLKMVSALAGVSPVGVARQYGYEAVSAGLGATAAGVALVALYEALAPIWGAQVARLMIAGALAAAALAAHALAVRRRREAEREAARARAEVFGVAGVAQSLLGPRVARFAPFAAFLAAFLLSQRR